MTSIVKDRPSNIILESLNRMNDAKLNGALTSDELSKIITLEGSLFANLVRRGLRTEEQSEDFLNQIPNGKWNSFSYPHKGQDVAFETVKQDVNVALYEQEKVNIQAQPVKIK